MTYSLSPSRLLSVMDPLLNLGILWRCLAAYVGIDFRIEADKHKSLLNLEKTPIENSTTTVQKQTTLSRALSGKRSKFRYSKSEASMVSSPLPAPLSPPLDIAPSYSVNSDPILKKSESSGKCIENFFYFFSM
jgi:hypothetical protein